MEKIIYQKNKILARGDTQKEIELNRKEMEHREKRMMDKQVKEEHKRRVELERESARKEYEIKEVRERERINYEKRIAKAQTETSFFDKLTKKLDSPSPQVRAKPRAKPKARTTVKKTQQVKKMKVPATKKYEVQCGKNFKWKV